MAKVSPSILAADFVNLERDIHEIEKSGADWIHVDVMDGSFVPNFSFGLPALKAIRGVTDMTLDVHLMIERPIRYVERFVAAGADWLTVHIEADTQENTLEALRMIRSMGCKAGISLKPGTRAEEAFPYLTLCDLILVMTVQPGFGGQKFKEDMMPKLSALRRVLDEVNPGCLLSVDGARPHRGAAGCHDAGGKGGADLPGALPGDGSGGGGAELPSGRLCAIRPGF